MIKNFKIFELNYETYINASQKARDYGHHTKSSNLEDWAFTNGLNRHGHNPKKWGVFSFDLNIYTDKRGFDTFMSETDFKKEKTMIYNLKQKGPIKGYITDIYLDEYMTDEDTKEEEHDFINLICDFVYVNDKGEVYKEKITAGRNKGGSLPAPASTAIMVPIIWEDDECYVSDSETVIETYGADYVSIFSNRADAMKFRKIIANMRTNLPETYNHIRDFFMERSSSDEFDKYMDRLKTLSVNKLFRA